MVVATIIGAILLFVSSCYQTYTLSKVHTLVNSNFTEAKQARITAEANLIASQDLALKLQKQLDILRGK